MIDLMIIPDDLIAWGKRPEIAIHFPRPWADQIEKLAARAPLDRRSYNMILGRLEALCAEAVRAGRPELLHGLDTRTAEMLDISYSIAMPGGHVAQIGRGKRYTWSEMRAVLATDDPKAAMSAMDRAKALLAEAFPGVRVSEVTREAPPAQPAAALLGASLGSAAPVDDAEAAEAPAGLLGPPGDVQACCGCGNTTSAVMLSTLHGTHYCGTCWTQLTSEAPVTIKPIKTKRTKALSESLDFESDEVNE